MKKKLYRFTVVLEQDGDGYHAYCPALEGCFTQGDSYEDAMKNMQEVIELCLADDLSVKRDVPSPDSVSFSTVEVCV